ncbi:MAG: Hpt domain-containing protein [Desulfobacterales bacterium]|nr:Hpt domain-containing protein [Desulfobacterales bacterium]
MRPAFRRAAHSLKGMLRNFQAEDAAEKAFHLETKGQAGDTGRRRCSDRGACRRNQAAGRAVAQSESTRPECPMSAQIS